MEGERAGREKGEWGRRKGGKTEKNRKRNFKKIPALETELPHNTLKHKKGLIHRRDFNRRPTVLSLDVVTWELCLISCINEGAP